MLYQDATSKKNRITSCHLYINSPFLSSFLQKSLKGELISILLLCFVSIVGSYAQKLPVSLVKDETDFLIEKVPSRGITFDIVEDSLGFIWAATQYGLLRFDGNEIKTYEYEPGNPFSLSENAINKVVLAANGKLWLSLIDNGLHLFNSWESKFDKFKNEPADSTSLVHNHAQTIFLDRSQNLWVGTSAMGLDKFSPSSKSFQHYYNPDQAEGAYSKTINDIYQDEEGNLWIASINGLSLYNTEKDSFKHFHTTDAEGYQKKNDFIAIEKVGDGLLLATNDEHLFWFNLEEESFVEYVFKNEDTEATNPGKIWDIFQDKQNRIWIAKEGGLFLVTDITQNNSGENTISYTCIRESNWAMKVYQSRDGTIWGGFSNGLYKILENLGKFKTNRFSKEVNGQVFRAEATSFSKCNNGSIWIGTSRGVYLYNKADNTFQQDFFDKPNLEFLKSISIFSLLEDHEKNLWVSTFSGFNANFNVYRINLNTWEITEIKKKHLPLLQSDFTSSITEDKKGNIWMGNSKGLVCYINNLDSFKLYQHNPDISSSLPENKVLKVFNDDVNRLWIGMETQGLAYYDPKSDTFTQCFEDNKKLFGYVHDIMASQNGRVWVGSKAGLYHYSNTGSFTGWTKKDGLPDNSVCSIMTDENGNIWAGTDKGFFKLAPFSEKDKLIKAKSKVTSFIKKEGYKNNDFWYRANYRDKAGNLYFGNGAGMVSFNPEAFTNSYEAPEVLLTDFFLFNQLQEPGNKILPQSISVLQELRLPYNQNVFSIRYSALEHKLTEKIKYAYMMEGFDEIWQEVGEQREAYYTNLSPGTYTFKVKATDNVGEWPQKFSSLQLVITPPWWLTWWAYLFYTVAACLALYSLYRLQLKRKLEVAENLRVIELDEFKSRFYTNITHEFRTPLTIINGISSQLVDTSNEQVTSLSKLIKKNADYLLVLINQLLDLSKVHSGKIALDVVQADVITFLQILLEPFAYTIQEKDLTFEFKKHTSSFFMDFDRERLRQIVYNLLSNAIKFTNEGSIKVWVNTKMEDGTQYFYLNVKDTGPGIPKSEQAKIFDNFYQTDTSSTRKHEGSGIGLSLTKELVLLMGGELSVDSEDGKGSLFQVKLPITNHAKMSAISPDLLEEVHDTTHSVNASMEEVEDMNGENKPILLSIEDNEDLRLYLQMIFKGEYQVIRCKDGLQGINKALKIIPDIIICDIMLPSADGFEICQKLKSDTRTSHVPFVFLTAKVSIKDRIKGLNLGADAYLHKPFSKDELLATIEKCISLRYKLRARYASLTAFLPSNDKATQANDNFMIKLNGVLKKHLINTHLNATLTADEMAMSRSQLHRKLKNITGKGLSRYIRYYRLIIAKQLLESSEKSISEISFEVGFNDPNYFSRMFFEEFGVRPSYIRQATD